MFSIKICSSLKSCFSISRLVSNIMSMIKFKVKNTFVRRNDEKGHTWYADSWSKIDNKLQNCLHTKFLLSFNNLAQVSDGCTSQLQLSYKSVWLSQILLFVKQTGQNLLQLGGRFDTFDALKHSLHHATYNSTSNTWASVSL